jgi:hypothetical protein
VSGVNCSMAQLPLISALDIFSHPELHNSHDDTACGTSMYLVFDSIVFHCSSTKHSLSIIVSISGALSEQFCGH